ncbi:MAG: MFS transporter [Gemmatimonadetes bacterium]|nr:MFS transporter [Gemmatimonadota bacterium]
MTAVPGANAGTRAPHPWLFAVLYFPMGLMIGYPSVALGYLASRAGLAVSTSAAIVGMAFFAHAFKFVWAPLGDSTLSRKRWYLIAATAMTGGLFTLTVTPLGASSVPLLSVVVLGSNVAASFLAFATEGLMAHNTTVRSRGRAAGWFQSGNQFGQTAGGGLGLWFVKHLPATWMAGLALAAVIGLCALALTRLEEPPRAWSGESVGGRLREALRALVRLLRSRDGRIALLLAALPIGTGAAQFLFGALGPEFHASADTVSFVLGAGGGVAIVLGCFAGGWLADRIVATRAYALACAVSALAAAFMMVAPRDSFGYAASTLFYTFALGLCVASLTGMVLALIGEHAAATKINVFFAFNTLGGLGMIRFDGAMHDRFATSGMLAAEALAGFACLACFVLLAGRVSGADRSD